VPPRKVILFVGAFRRPASGLIGGQIVACQLLAASPLAKALDLPLVDTTMKSLPPPGFLVRSWYALVRLTKVVGYLIFRRVDGLFVFAPLLTSGLLDRGLMCIAGRLLGRRVVISLRNEIRPLPTLRWLTEWYARMVLRSCHAIHCQNQIAAGNLVRFYACDPAKLVVIPNWIDVESYNAAIEEHARRPSRDVPVVLFTGWLEDFKGVFELAEAAGRLVERGLKFRLVYCGSGIHHEQVVQRCHELGLDEIVEFRGWVNDEQKRAALVEADLFVFPSHREGLPNALLEAMAAGLAVVTTPVGGIPSVVQTGRNGILVPPRDAARLAEAIERLLRDEPLRRKMGAANRRQIEQEHDLTAIWPRVAAMLTGDTEWNDVVVAQREAVSAVGGSLANEAQVG
jgi:glycosyltransferase involved in cell wall biosynthesis